MTRWKNSFANCLTAPGRMKVCMRIECGFLPSFSAYLMWTLKLVVGKVVYPSCNICANLTWKRFKVGISTNNGCGTHNGIRFVPTFFSRRSSHHNLVSKLA